MEPSRQFSFRLPKTLVQRVEDCAEEMRSKGLEVTRADVVRLLLNHALDTTKCNLTKLLRTPASKRTNVRKKPN